MHSSFPQLHLHMSRAILKQAMVHYYLYHERGVGYGIYTMRQTHIPYMSLSHCI